MTTERDDDGDGGINWSEVAMTVGITLAVLAAVMAIAQHVPALRQWFPARTSSPEAGG